MSWFKKEGEKGAKPKSKISLTASPILMSKAQHASLFDEESAVAKIAEDLRLGRFADVEKNLQESTDRSSFWILIEKAVAISHGDDHVFTQHGIQRRITRSFSKERQRLLIAKIIETMDILREKIGVEYFVTSGTLLGLIREKALIAHDDDVDLAYISKEQDRFNWALERVAIIKLLSSLPGGSATDHLPGLIHVGITLADGSKARFDLFSAIIEKGRFIEYPLDVDALTENEILPLQTAEFLECNVPIPALPEKFLTANYGEGWRIPDPTFRFDWALSGKQYVEWLAAMRKEAPPLPWLKRQILNTCGSSTPKAGQNFDYYKIAALKYVFATNSSASQLMILGATSAGLIDFCTQQANDCDLGFHVVDPLEPLDSPIGPYSEGTVMASTEIRERANRDKRLNFCSYIDFDEENLALEGKVDVLYVDSATKQSTINALKFAEKYLKDECAIICDDFLYSHDKHFYDGQYCALIEWYKTSPLKQLKCVGRTEWAQAIFIGKMS